MFHRNEGMRIDLLYATAPVASRVIWAEIDREARKGPPTPSDHAPVVMDVDAPGHPLAPESPPSPAGAGDAQVWWPRSRSVMRMVAPPWRTVLARQSSRRSRRLRGRAATRGRGPRPT